MDLDRAVSRTLAYAQYFKFPLTPEEVCYWLIFPKSVSSHILVKHLPSRLSQKNQKLRQILTLNSRKKIKKAQNLANYLKWFPGIKLIALTGSVAAGNSQAGDDIDLFFITSPYTLWLLRPLIIVFLSLFFRRRHPHEDHSHAPDAFCPNLWLDSLALAIPPSKRNLYTAHEVLQIVPLFDRGNTYRAFLLANSWTKKYLANAFTATTKQNLSLRTRRRRVWQSSLRVLLAPLNYFFYLLQLLYMNPKKTTELVTPHSAYLHTTDFSTPLRKHLSQISGYN